MNLPVILLLVGVVLLFKYLSKPHTASAPRSLKSAQVPAAMPVLPASQLDPLTEAAFNQQAVDFAPALGESENTDGEEPLNAL